MEGTSKLSQEVLNLSIQAQSCDSHLDDLNKLRKLLEGKNEEHMKLLFRLDSIETEVSVLRVC